ncbi:hypothetical protein D9M70_537110 [compost metagenome]
MFDVGEHGIGQIVEFISDFDLALFAERQGIVGEDSQRSLQTVREVASSAPGILHGRGLGFQQRVQPVDERLDLAGVWPCQAPDLAVTHRLEVAADAVEGSQADPELNDRHEDEQHGQHAHIGQDVESEVRARVVDLIRIHRRRNAERASAFRCGQQQNALLNQDILSLRTSEAILVHDAERVRVLRQGQDVIEQ